MVLGALFVVVGALFILYPGTLMAPNHVSDRTYLVRVPPGSYSNFSAEVGPRQTLTATISSSPEPVDFFLMNSSNFAAWTSRGNPPTNVYPQSSKFNATNYSFAVAGTGTTQNYTLVFISLSSNTPNNVLLNLVVDNQAGFLQANAAPLIAIVCGVALALFGATRRSKVVEKPEEEEESHGGEGGLGGGLLGGIFGGSSAGERAPVRKCRYCGAELQEGAAFCSSCRMSQL